MTDRLSPYREKRSAKRTPEPIPAEGPLPRGRDDTFVIQEHHARRLHFDFRLEHDGVLVSWAIPKGLPDDPQRNNLAIHTEDHPLEYAAFEGEIPRGEYGGGQVMIWDRGTYDCETWTDREVKVVLHGQRARGRYVLFQTRGKNWMIHRMDGVPARGPVPELIGPMLATLGQLPPSEQDDRYGYESKWDGLRAVAYLTDRSLRLMTRNDIDVTTTYPELRGLTDALGGLPAVLDGEIVAFDRSRISFGALQQRMHVQDPVQVERLARRVPVQYYLFDILYFDGHSTISLPYEQRRELLEGLQVRGPHWDTPPYARGGGAELLAASAEQGLEGIMAKRLDSRYEPGRRSGAWIKIKNVSTQEVIIAGWKPGKGSRAGTIGAVVLGVPGPRGLEYVGQVGTGFTQRMLGDLLRQLRRDERETTPFASDLPARERRGVRWVNPRLVGEVRFSEWTRDGKLRHPSWRGLRPDKSPGEVSRSRQ